ncbi:MAG: AraC family transcriptional regulator [Lachnospiraceae bacterium]|nr:AraC family transcriptional regulator [Lachnospiraceae bacterium]
MNTEMLFHYKDNGLFVKHALTHHPDPQDFSFRSHYHNTYEIYYFLRGQGDLAVEGNVYPLKRGMLLLTSKGQTHNIRVHHSNESYERFVIMFEERLLPDGADPVLLALQQEQNCFQLTESDAAWLENCFATLETAGQHDMPTDNITVAIINLIFLKLCQYVQTTNPDLPPGDDIVRQIIRYINAHLTEDWDLDTLERVFFRNKAYLNRRFKSVMGCSIWEYVIRKRIFSAQQEIYLSKSVAAAYKASGFHDYSAFYRKYIKYIGCSPSEDLRRSN